MALCCSANSYPVTRTRNYMKTRPERPFFASAHALSIGVATLLTPVSPAFAAEPAALDIQKAVSTTDVVGPGDTFQWTILVGCSVITDHCVDAWLVDVIPPQFEVRVFEAVNGCTASSGHTVTPTSAAKGCSTASEVTLALASARRALHIHRTRPQRC